MKRGPLGTWDSFDVGRTGWAGTRGSVTARCPLARDRPHCTAKEMRGPLSCSRRTKVVQHVLVKHYSDALQVANDIGPS